MGDNETKRATKSSDQRTVKPDADNIVKTVEESPVKDTPLVLVIEEQPEIRQMLGVALCQSGFTVCLAATGQEAVDVYRKYQNEIALVLLDVQMSELDGPATLAVLRQINPKLKCCFMSGNTGKYTTHELLDLGDTRFLEKPFVSLDLLSQCLRDMIGSR